MNDPDPGPGPVRIAVRWAGDDGVVGGRNETDPRRCNDDVNSTDETDGLLNPWQKSMSEIEVDALVSGGQLHFQQLMVKSLPGLPRRCGLRKQGGTGQTPGSPGRSKPTAPMFDTAPSGRTVGSAEPSQARAPVGSPHVGQIRWRFIVYQHREMQPFLRGEREREREKFRKQTKNIKELSRSLCCQVYLGDQISAVLLRCTECSFATRSRATGFARVTHRRADGRRVGS